MPAEDQTSSGTVPFDPNAFLATAGPGRTISVYRANKTVIAQGADCDAVFYILQGKVKLTYAFDSGKEAVFAIIGAGQLFGHRCIASETPHKFAASTLTQSTITRVPKPRRSR